MDIYYSAVKDDPEKRTYECFLEPDARLPMMYMDDAVEAVTELLEADDAKLTQRKFRIRTRSEKKKRKEKNSIVIS